MNSPASEDSNFQVDLTNCDREPIHIPALVQAHGVLTALNDALQIRQISANCRQHLGKSAEELLNQSIKMIFDDEYFDYFTDEVLPQNLDKNPFYLNPLEIAGERFELLAHRFEGILIVEFEHQPAESLKTNQNIYSSLRVKLSEINNSQSVAEFCGHAAETVRSFTGFDRVMIYRFLEDDSGKVIAESMREGLEPYLGLHYPASDIPKQARALYLRQTLRFKVDVDDVSAPIAPTLNPQTGMPLDLSFAATRAMSPIHVEYLKNLGVAASMSISIVKDGKLWGLIACHHGSPRYIPHQARLVSEFVAHNISLQIDSKTNAENFEYISRLKDANTEIIAELSRTFDIPQCLIHGENNLLANVEADGAALILDDKIYLIGKTPDEYQVKKLVEWLWKDQTADIFATAQISQHLPSAEEFANHTSGILAVRLTKQTPEYILWFRAEYAHTVTWAGNPEKSVNAGEFGTRLTPRKSFEAWREEVSGKSQSWKSFEIEFAQSLRLSIVEVILRRANELRELNKQLEESNSELDSFAYVASHDLKEPLRGISNYSSFLLEDFTGQLPEEVVEKLQTLVRLSERMENLLDSLLHYSRVGRLELQKKEIDLQQILEDALFFLKTRIDDNQVEIVVPQPLPKVFADEMRAGEIFSNLISNAIKYNDKKSRRVEIGLLENVLQNIADESKTETIFYVRDNGIGIEKRHHANIFRIFKRLHGRTEFSGGVGAGLTIVQKIVERHGGRIWLESVFGEGTTFYFTFG